MDLEQQTRFNYFSKFVSPQHKGIEIGPLTRPTFPPETGYHVDSLDHADTESLIKKYAQDPNIDVSEIQPTDWVWSGGPYTSIPDIPKDFDFLVSCHSIEHSEDLVQFLRDCSDLLKQDGLVFLTVPDKRLEFDFYRPTTTLGDVLMGHHFATALDFKARVDELEFAATLGSEIAWTEVRGVQAAIAGKRPTPIRDDTRLFELLSEIDKWAEESGYRDGHRWVFEPISLWRILEGLRQLGLTDLVVSDYQQGANCEFMMTLTKNADAARRVSFDLDKYRETLVPPSFSRRGLLSAFEARRARVLAEAVFRKLGRAPRAILRRVKSALTR